MTWKVDTPIRVRDTVIAAIVELEIKASLVGPASCCYASKQPLMFLQFHGNNICGLDVNGHQYDEVEIELLYPNAIVQVRDQHVRVQ